MYAILAFDTEDVYYPPDAGIDDTPGWLAATMTDVGVRGTFFVMGEKAESLEKRGRTDVLEQMARHDIASHQQGNRYPLVPQVVEGLGWTDGVAAVRQYEAWVTERLVSAFGKEPVALSRHNNYVAPQHVALAGERGLPYSYLPIDLPHGPGPVWYAGALTVPETSRLFFGGFDTIYSRDELFEARLEALDRFLQDRLAENCELVVTFGCHPILVTGRGWLEHHVLTTGKSRSPRELGWHFEVKSGEERERARASFRRLCAYLRGHPDLEVVGIEEAARILSTQPACIDRDALVDYAVRASDGTEIPLHPTFSPAELVCGLAESLVHHRESGDLPGQVERRPVLGPTTRPVVAQETDSVTHEELVNVCQELVGQVRSSGHLPANLAASGARLGLGQIAVLAARSYQALARCDRYERLSVPTVSRYPAIAAEFETWIRRAIGEHWAMPLDFSCEALAEQARLQTWTVKPAWKRPPQGPVPDRRYQARRRMS